MSAVGAVRMPPRSHGLRVGLRAGLGGRGGRSGCRPSPRCGTACRRCRDGAEPVKLTLYRPILRDEVTVKELEGRPALAYDLGFGSVWTLGRIVVREASCRVGLK